MLSLFMNFFTVIGWLDFAFLWKVCMAIVFEIFLMDFYLLNIIYYSDSDDDLLPVFFLKKVIYNMIFKQ